MLEKQSCSILPWTNWCGVSGASIVFHMVDHPVTPYGEAMAGRPVPVPPPDMGFFWSYSPTGQMINLLCQDAIREERDLYFAGYKLAANQPVEWLSYVFRWMFAHARQLHSERDLPDYAELDESYREAQNNQIYAITSFLEMPIFQSMRLLLFTSFMNLPHSGIAMAHAATRVSTLLPSHWHKVEWGHKTCPGSICQTE